MSDKTSTRKANHIDLAFLSQIADLDPRFNYEPLLAGHPSFEAKPFEFATKTVHHPLWISSMTGGTEQAGKINQNLAKIAGKYGLGMGLGSCRIILDDDTYLNDFKLRSLIGDDFPFYANLGIAQLEELIFSNKLSKVRELIDKTETDGLIIHVNPMQEWLQPEGDHFTQSPLTTIKQTLDAIDVPVIVKEVGQGMGPKSLVALAKLPITAIDFGAHGGTNFAALEILRHRDGHGEQFKPLTYVGHSAEQMIGYCNAIFDAAKSKMDVIISGGVKGFLDGYYYRSKLNASSVYGQASSLLKYAAVGYDALDAYVESELKGYQLAETYLEIK